MPPTPRLTADHDPTSDLLDVDGRPIGEIGSARYATVETELGACPYHDARHGRPMNVSALRQVSRVWPEVRALVAAIGTTTTHPGTVAGAWQTALTGTAWPAAWAQANPEKPIPLALSALYKTSLGFSQVLTAMLLSADGMADEVLHELGGPEAFVDLLDRERWLVGSEQVCAGPPGWIAEGLTVLATPTTGPALPDDLGAIGRRRATWVGVHVAFIGAARQLPGAEVAPRVPCLRAAQTLPGRQATHARRLFAEGDVPEAIEAFLRELSAASTLGQLERLRDACAGPG